MTWIGWLPVFAALYVVGLIVRLRRDD